jgi:DNA modification methylase
MTSPDLLRVNRVEIIGDCTLHLADCLDVLPTLGKVDAVVTDPPYGINDAPFEGGKRSGKRTGGDNVWHSESHWDAEINPAWAAACCSAADTVAWFGHWRKREQVERAMSLPLRAEIIWAKDCHVGPPSPLAMRDERVWLFGAKGIKGATFETSVWDQPIIPTWSHKNHKNEKPVPLMMRLIRFLGSQTTIDPFMGSGTTGVACVNLDRPFVGIEKEAEHFETACRRIEEAYKQPRLFAEPAPKPTQEALL